MQDISRTTEELTQEEVERAVRALRWRKEYAKRPKVRAARRLYMQRRQAVVKAAMEAYRRMQEGGK